MWIGWFGDTENTVFEEGEEAGFDGGIVFVARDGLVAGAWEVVGI